MSLPARLFGSDREEIVDMDSWLAHAPPEKGAAQWKDGYSAKEQAKAWLREGVPRMPAELWGRLSEFASADEVYGRPEHKTPLDRYGRARQHDMFACLRRAGQTTLAVGVEAKACEDFAGTVADRATAAAPSKKRARCNLLARALFGRDVLDEESGAVLDAGLAEHGYQLWTAAVGTIIETQRRDLDRAVLVVHQLRPRDIEATRSAGDARNWSSALRANGDAFDRFASAFTAAGSTSHETEFVKPGTTLAVVKVDGFVEPSSAV